MILTRCAVEQERNGTKLLNIAGGAGLVLLLNGKKAAAQSIACCGTGDTAALHLRAIEGLALAVEAKDNLNTRGHLRRVQVHALEVGKDLGLRGQELEALHAAALLRTIAAARREGRFPT